MLGEEFTGKSCYENFFKLKNKIMLGEFHVSRIHVCEDYLYFEIEALLRKIFLKSQMIL